MAMTGLLLGTMCLLLMIGVPIAFGIGIASQVTMWALNTPVFANIAYLPRVAFYAMDSFNLMAVPFFLLSGDLMVFGLAERLVRWIQSILGRVRGSLGVIAILACMFFGAISGVFMATIAAIGAIMLPEMEKAGYDKNKSAALITASGFLGILIPPSVPSLIYATTAGVSVSELFLATIVPGVIMAAGYIVINYFELGRYAPVSEVPAITSKEGLEEFGRSTVGALPVLMMPAIVMGGIYTGVFTPTEAGVIAVVYALGLGTIWKQWKGSTLLKTFLGTGRSTATIMILIALSAPLGRIFSVLKIPELIADVILGITTNQYGVILIISLVIFIMGMFLDTNAIIFITVPAFLPLVELVGFDPLQYAAVTVVNLGIGCITPPFGYGLFMGARIANVSVHKIIKPLLPYMLWCIVVLLLVIFIPELTTGLPALMAK